jgi:hypothetical protein
MSWDARLVFHHLWSYVEDNGVNYDSPKLIKSMCMPYDCDQVVSRIEAALDELEKLDCVIRYERDGHRLLFLPGFRKWQKVPHPGACHFLPPNGYDKQGYPVSHEDSCDSHESLTTSTESLTTSRAFSSSSRSSSNKKEEENKFSSSKEKTDLAAFQTNRERAHANSEIIKAYPDLDLSDSWNAFTTHHYGETRTVTDWCRQWKGWCERRAKMSGIPPSKPHKHSWQCDHVLAQLGRTLETAQPDQTACALADQLNKENQ